MPRGVRMSLDSERNYTVRSTKAKRPPRAFAYRYQHRAADVTFARHERGTGKRPVPPGGHPPDTRS